MQHTKKPNTDRYLVSQSNDLVEATYSSALPARAHKVARLILALINPADQDLRLYTIKIDDLKQYLGYSGGTWGRFYDDLKDISKRLNSEPIEIKSDKRTLVAYFISSYVIDLREGTVVYEISSQLKPYLVQLKGNYSAYLLSNIPKLSSKYSIRLYELLHQYRRIGRRLFEVDELQKMVGSEYNKYSHFKARVLDTSKSDIENNTDLAFEYEELKEGKKVTRIEFFIYPNKPQKEDTGQQLLSFMKEESAEGNGLELSETILTTLKDLGINEKNVEKHVALGFKIIEDEKARKEAIRRCEDLEGYYLEKINLVRVSKAATAGNPAGFLIKALQEDWQSPKVQREQKIKETAKETAQARNQLKQLEALRERLEAERMKSLAPVYRKLSEDEEAFAAAYESVISELGGVVKQSILSSRQKLSPVQQYQDSVMLKSLVNLQFQKSHPALFTAINEEYTLKMKQVDGDIAAQKREG